MKDSEFLRDRVPMTKEAIRAISIDKLEVHKAKRFLDIGAGTGSISLQIASMYPDIEVIAIENKLLASQLIQKNCEHLKINNVKIIQEKAPINKPLGKFQAIFIGGNGGNLSEIIEWIDELMDVNSNLVLNFILQEHALEAEYLLKEKGWKEVEMISVSVSDWTQLGSGHYFKPQNTTLILSAKKGENNEK
ncbi:decarboxylating cobalt-precorrin-6B (C(15))-methyltransferase [Ignavigranum ruoffiae]|uniref:Glucose-inhibited division protein B n=1 Tax=Ignavigranum ruoffiae TaxID=89093 RepID=A0A1H9CEQ7_9LACT|nr:decarboxylating cobalt-precorrin-6B (C(15))-methyltransferase [Ignavigranum ruoffiae]SEP99676.1 cobalt-precorrin 7 C15-methyltransferase [Ignavigranum ruoffiae]